MLFDFKMTWSGSFLCAPLILLIVKIKNVAKMISVFFSNNVLLFYTSEHIKDAPLYSIKQNQNLCLSDLKFEPLEKQKWEKCIVT